MVGSAWKALQGGTRKSLGWSTKPSSGLTTRHHATSMVMRSHGLQSCCQAWQVQWQHEVVRFTQLHEYKTFKVGKGAKAPEGYRKIRVHLIFDVKHNGWHRSRLVANGHLTEVPLDSIYSGVILLCRLSLLLFLAELNNLWCLSNRYWQHLPCQTQEKVYIIAGTKFGELEGHIFIIFEEISTASRLQTSIGMNALPAVSVTWDSMQDIWMWCTSDIYEYIAIYMDYIAAAARDPKAITDLVQHKYPFKLKGRGSISFHLGWNFIRDEDGTMCLSPRK